MDLNASSMSESLAASLTLEWKFYDNFFSYALRLILTESVNVFNSLNKCFSLFLAIALLLINFNFIAVHMIIRRIWLYHLIIFSYSLGAVFYFVPHKV